MKLSDRVRPDVEAAPWVIEEIKNLRAERDAMLSALKWTIENCTYENHGDLYGYPCDCCATPIEIPAEHKAAIDAARSKT